VVFLAAAAVFFAARFFGISCTVAAPAALAPRLLGCRYRGIQYFHQVHDLPGRLLLAQYRT
jgi:hypothetical protein